MPYPERFWNVNDCYTDSLGIGSLHLYFDEKNQKHGTITKASLQSEISER